MLFTNSHGWSSTKETQVIELTATEPKIYID